MSLTLPPRRRVRSRSEDDLAESSTSAANLAITPKDDDTPLRRPHDFSDPGPLLTLARKMLMCLVNSPSAYRDLGGIRGRVLISTDKSVSWRAVQSKGGHVS